MVYDCHRCGRFCFSQWLHIPPHDACSHNFTFKLIHLNGIDDTIWLIWADVLTFKQFVHIHFELFISIFLLNICAVIAVKLFVTHLIKAFISLYTSTWNREHKHTNCIDIDFNLRSLTFMTNVQLSIGAYVGWMVK